MTETATLFGPVADAIPLVGDRLRKLAVGQHSLLGEALAYVFESEGKRIRPALVLLSGRLGTYDVDRLVTLSASLEAVHTATLVHDDTIDQALTRRGLRTVNAVWDAKVAILIGDFLFAQSAYLAAQLDNVRVMSMLSETVMAMSSGELQQYASSRNRAVDEADYLQRITGKTASLFAMCCGGAAVVSEQSEEQIDALRTFGNNIGIGFQIADDVLDFMGDESNLGKPSGSDLRQGTVTLPVILYAQEHGLRDPNLQDLLDGRDVNSLVAAVRESDAIEESLQRAEEYAREARRALEIFPESQAKETLIALSYYLVRRSR